jgi:predicted amidohydrolase
MTVDLVLKHGTVIDPSRNLHAVRDVAPAKSHFSFEHARIGLDAGIFPTVLSTDITKTNYQGPALFSLPVVMSKFLALGLKLEVLSSEQQLSRPRY